MEFLRRHAALLVLVVIIAIGFYILGFNSGEKSLSTAVVGIENTAEGAPGACHFSALF